MLSFRVLPRSILDTGTNADLPGSGPSRAPHPASPACTVYPACPEPLGELRGEPRTATSHSLIPHPRPLASSISFRINTCKSVSKQTTLTCFRINTYEKHRGEGVLVLARNPKKDFYPEGTPRVLCAPDGLTGRLKDLSSFPMRESLLGPFSLHGSRVTSHASPSRFASPPGAV
jgi:hypothetical protein